MFSKVPLMPAKRFQISKIYFIKTYKITALQNIFFGSLLGKAMLKKNSTLYKFNFIEGSNSKLVLIGQQIETELSTI